MEVPIEAPREIKKAVAKRLQKSGALRRIERKIKLGMLVAVEEIREDPKAPGNLERRKFKDASPHEVKALQAIYNFLAERNMTYTLSCLLEESSVRRNQADTTDLLELLEDEGVKAKKNLRPRPKAQQSRQQPKDEIIDESDSFQSDDDGSQPLKSPQKRGISGSAVKRRDFDRNKLVVSVDDL